MSQIMPQMRISEFVWMHVRFRLSKSTSQIFPGWASLEAEYSYPTSKHPLPRPWRARCKFLSGGDPDQTNSFSYVFLMGSCHGYRWPTTFFVLTHPTQLDFAFHAHDSCHGAHFGPIEPKQKLQNQNPSAHLLPRANLCSGCCKQNRAPPQTMGRNPAKGCQRYARFAPVRKNSETIYYCNLMILISILDV